MINKNNLPNTDSFRTNLTTLSDNITYFFQDRREYKGISLSEKINLLNSVISNVKKSSSPAEERALVYNLQKNRFLEITKYFIEHNKDNEIPLLTFNEITYAEKIINNFPQLEKSAEERMVLFNSFKLLVQKEEINIGCIFLNMKNINNSEAATTLYDHLIHKKLKTLCVEKLNLIDSKIENIESIENSKNKYEGLFKRSNPLLNNLIVQSYIDKIKSDFSGLDLDLFDFIYRKNQENSSSLFITEAAKNIQLSNNEKEKITTKLESILEEVNDLANEHKNYMSNLKDRDSLIYVQQNPFPVTVTPVKKIEMPEPQKLIDFSRLTPKDRLRENLLKQIEKKKNKSNNSLN